MGQGFLTDCRRWPWGRRKGEGSFWPGSWKDVGLVAVLRAQKTWVGAAVRGMAWMRSFGRGFGEQAQGTLSRRRLRRPWGLLCRHVGWCPEENARVGGWERRWPGRQRGQAGSIPLGKNGQCVCVLRLPFLVPSLPEAGSRPQGLLSVADSSPWPLTRAEFLLPKWGSLYSFVGSGRTSSLGLSPSLKGKQL